MFGVSEDQITVVSYPEGGEIVRLEVEFPTAGLTQEQIDKIVGEEVTGMRDGTEYVLEVTGVTERNHLVFEPLAN
jgi:hypothetical protein